MPNGIGYSVNGVCYNTTSEALVAINKLYPTVLGDVVYTVSASSLLPGPSYSLEIKHWDNATNAYVYSEASDLFTLCAIPSDYVGMGSLDPTQSYILFSLIFIVAMMGFRAGFRP